MSCEVVLSCYNGAEYIIQQLDSIRDQTVKADYVTICDDCSTDGTYQIVRDYIDNNGLDQCNWSVRQNNPNKGWKYNFMTLADECKADWIVFADQDDVWNLHKIEWMSRYFDCGEYNYISGGFRCIVNVEDKPFDDVAGKIGIKTLCFNPKYTYVKFPGCAIAVRKVFFDHIRPYYDSEMAHDELCFLFALLTDTVGVINQDLIIHRMRSEPIVRSIKELKSTVLDKDLMVADKLRQYIADNDLESDYAGKLKVIDKACRWAELRRSYYNKPTLAGYLTLVTCYRSYYLRFRSLVKEFILGFKR